MKANSNNENPALPETDLPQPNPNTPHAPQPSHGLDSSPIKIQNSKFKNTKRPLYGRVARLPSDLRRQINQMLDDHTPFAKIVQNLGDAGQGLTTKCIKGWKA